MNSFEQKTLVEDQSLALLQPALDKLFPEGLKRLKPYDPRGDYICLKTGLGAEFKASRKSRDDTFWFETWSDDGKRPGWIYTLISNLLLYHDIAGDLLHVMDFAKLRSWWIEHAEDDWPTMTSEDIGVHQGNLTTWRVVPIKMLMAAGVIMGSVSTAPRKESRLEFARGFMQRTAARTSRSSTT